LSRANGIAFANFRTRITRIFFKNVILAAVGMAFFYKKIFQHEAIEFNQLYLTLENNHSLINYNQQ
jgi:hypothetical protein